MRAARFAEAAQQSIVARFDEHERRGMFAAQLAIDSRELFELLALARVHQQRRALDFAAPAFVKFTERGNQRDGKIIDAVEAEIFEGLENGALPEPESPVRITSWRASFAVGGASRETGYAFTRRWCVLGMRRSSRYFATVRRVTWMPSSSSFLVICSSVSG